VCHCVWRTLGQRTSCGGGGGGGGGDRRAKDGISHKQSRTGTIQNNIHPTHTMSKTVAKRTNLAVGDSSSFIDDGDWVVKTGGTSSFSRRSGECTSLLLVTTTASLIVRAETTRQNKDYRY
jgi:hypothetical protein